MTDAHAYTGCETRNSAPIPLNRQDSMNRHTIRYALILIAALAVAALAVARFDGLCSIFSTVWSALEPLAIGAVLA